MSKDENGHGLLHKAVYHGHTDIVYWLLENYPETVDVKDWVCEHLQFWYCKLVFHIER